MTPSMRVGFIGLGKMGLPMATNILKAGFPLVLYNRAREKADELIRQGARVAETPKDLASGTEVVISMISDDTALEAIALGPGGLLKGAKAGAIYIDMSTVSPEVSAHVAQAADERKVGYLRAPVSGSTHLAMKAGLTILVSGPRETYDRCLELFHTLGQKVFYIGPGEEARFLKLMLNLMVGLTSAMTAEALAFGERGGLDLGQMVDILNQSAVASPLLGYKAQMLKDRNFSPAFTIDQMAKDFDLALDAGRDLKAPLPMTAMVRQFLGMMQGKGRGDLDFFSLVTLMEDLAGMKVEESVTGVHS